jgi:hypothetical protein
MQWTDVVKPPSQKHLRQFAGLFLVIFLGFAAWRWFTGNQGTLTQVLGAVAIVVGGLGLVLPSAIRPIYTGWMIAAFPIGWTVSRIVLGVVYFLVVTPIGQFFKVTGRDALGLKRHQASSYWTAKRGAASAREYFRQS